MAHLLFLLLSLPCFAQRVSSKPIHGGGWDTTFTCPAVSYPKSTKTCEDAQCGLNKVCASCGSGPNRTNLASCCEHGQMPPPGHKGKYPCKRQVLAGGDLCQWRCCSSPLSVLCSDGCCKPSDQGAPHKCGRTPGQHKPCCVTEGASPEEQLDSGCCIRGDGLDCRSGPPHVVCCLWAQGDNGNASDPDPYSPCQIRNCSKYVPCPTGEGYDCSVHGQQICCLRTKAGYISAQDPCQRAQGDCSSRWRQCSGKIGSDCAKGGAACCLSDDPDYSGSCFIDCNDYRPGVLWEIVLIVVGIVACIAACIALVWYRWCRAPMHENRAARRPPALVIANSSYQEPFEILPFAKKDGEEMVIMLSDLGYEVIYAFNATLRCMKAKRNELLDSLSGTNGYLVPIYFAGHGLEVAGSQLLVPVDATAYDPSCLEFLSSFLQPSRMVHVPGTGTSGQDGCSPAICATFVCFLDICRALVPEAKREHFARVAAEAAKPPSMRRQEDAASFFVLKACQPGGVAQESADGHGYFTRAVLQHGKDRSASLQQLADRVMEQVKRETSDDRREKPSLRVQCPSLESESARAGDLILARLDGGPPRCRSGSGRSDASLLEGALELGTDGNQR